MNKVSETWKGFMRIVLSSSGMGPLDHVRNMIMYVPLWGTIDILTYVIFWLFFPLLFCNLKPKI